MSKTTKTIIISIILFIVIRMEFIIFNAANKTPVDNKALFLLISMLIIGSTIGGAFFYWGRLLKGRSIFFHIVLCYVFPCMIVSAILFFVTNMIFGFFPI